MRAMLTIGDLTVPILLGSLNPRDETGDQGVSAVQARLANLGYWPGPLDGILGPRTQAALRLFQGDHNLEMTGEDDDDTVKALFDEHGS
jgi:peptidoglycan hydrolase-like protein with peptidoglycan-binding domain